MNTLANETDFADVTNIRPLRRGNNLNYSGMTNIIKVALTKGRQEGQNQGKEVQIEVEEGVSERERGAGVMLLALKMEEGVASGGMSAALRSWKR